MGISEFLISSTIVAAGTSLPELVTSVAAALKKEMDISVGNIVGSNIFNIFLIMGVSATISPLTVPIGINLDLIVLAIATLLFFVFMFAGGKHKFERWKALIFLAIYVVYTLFIINRG
jgi:cation:H+ antiporter